MFDVTVLGASGTSLDSVSFQFDEDITNNMSSLRAGATLNGLMHILYDGDGEYAIELTAGFGFGDLVEIVFDVEKDTSLTLSDFDISSLPTGNFTSAVTSDSLGLGETFEFDGLSGLLEITFGDELVWGQVTNSWSDLYGADVFGVLITVTNIGEETGSLNMFDFVQFGSYGLCLSSIGSSFDDDITWSADMRAGATQEGFLYFLFDGNGEYAVEFSSGFGFGDNAEVVFNVQR